MNDRKISDKENDYVLKVWNKFKKKTIKDYHDLHLKFGKFRNNTFKNYGFCPRHYLDAPLLSWDAMLKIKKRKRDEISYISNKCSKI